MKTKALILSLILMSSFAEGRARNVEPFMNDVCSVVQNDPDCRDVENDDPALCSTDTDCWAFDVLNGRFAMPPSEQLIPMCEFDSRQEELDLPNLFELCFPGGAE